MRALFVFAALAAAAAAGTLSALALLGSDPGRAAPLATLTVAAAAGVGWELAHPGTAAALFLLLAVGALTLSLLTLGGGREELTAMLLFGTTSALIAAVGAWAGASLRERRDERAEGATKCRPS